MKDTMHRVDIKWRRMGVQAVLSVRYLPANKMYNMSMKIDYFVSENIANNNILECYVHDSFWSGILKRQECFWLV